MSSHQPFARDDPWRRPADRAPPRRKPGIEGNVASSVFLALLVCLLPMMGDGRGAWLWPPQFAFGALGDLAAWFALWVALRVTLPARTWEVGGRVLTLLAALVLVVGHAALCAWGKEASLGPPAMALGVRLGLLLGFPWLAWVELRDQLRDTFGHPWSWRADIDVPLSLLGELLVGKPMGPTTPAALFGTLPRVLRSRGDERVDLAGLSINPKLLERWRPAGGDPGAPPQATRRMLWLLALNLGIAQTKESAVRMVDEAGAVALLLRELSAREWAWAQRGWVALDRHVDERMVASLEATAWIDALPHSPRTVQGWQAFWAENLRRGVAEYHARKVAEGDPDALRLDALRAELAAIERADREDARVAAEVAVADFDAADELEESPEEESYDEVEDEDSGLLGCIRVIDLEPEVEALTHADIAALALRYPKRDFLC